MKFQILHEIKGRMRIRISCKQMSCRDADILQYGLSVQPSVTMAKVYERSQDAVIGYTGERRDMIKLLQQFSVDHASVPEHVWQNSGRKVNRYYQEKIIWKVALHIAEKLFLPIPVSQVYLEGRQHPGTWEAGGFCSGRNRHHRVPFAPGYENSRIGDVFTGNRGDFGGMDP